MKKLLAVFMAVMMVSGIAGCSSQTGATAQTKGEDGQVSSPSDDAAGAAEELTFVIIPKCVHEWFEAVNYGAREEAKALSEKLGVQIKIDYRAPGTAEITEQNSVLEQVAATKPDGIAIDPIDYEGSKQIIEEIQAQGIPVVLFDSAVEGSGLTAVGNDFAEQAELEAKKLAQLLGEKGKVGLMHGVTTAPNHSKRYETFKEVLAGYPGIEVIDGGISQDNIETAQQQAAILKARNLTKIFPGVVALDAVNITLRRGEVHCICGENGAGKSTLIKCLTGVYEPEEGEIQIDGRDVRGDRKLFEKVAYVPQEIDLFPHMSVAENLFMPFFRSDIKGFISQAGLNRKAAPILERFGIRVTPSSAAQDIPVSQQQLLQVARAAVFKGYEILMLDEPTTSLTGEDTQKLFQIIRQLKAEGKSIVFISHKLEEVFEIGDVITVFRNGKNTGMVEVADMDIAGTVKKMTGQVLNEREVFYSERVSQEIVMEVRGLSGERFRNISFTLRKGEILGFSGLVGAGRSELMQAIFGCLPVYSGEVRVKREKWKLGDTNYSVRHGMFYLPEERRTQGILSDLSIRENASVNALKYIGGRFGISREKEEEMVSGIIEAYDVKKPDMEKQIKYLSGGNQQKVIIGRAMSCKPEILIFDEPTKGIDVGTKAEIYRLMKKIAQERQVGIILISSEMNELRKCANRIISLYNGRKAGEHRKNADEQEILRAILGLGSGGDTYAGRK